MKDYKYFLQNSLCSLLQWMFRTYLKVIIEVCSDRRPKFLHMIVFKVTRPKWVLYVTSVMLHLNYVRSKCHTERWVRAIHSYRENIFCDPHAAQCNIQRNLSEQETYKLTWRAQIFRLAVMQQIMSGKNWQIRYDRVFYEVLCYWGCVMKSEFILGFPVEGN